MTSPSEKRFALHQLIETLHDDALDTALADLQHLLGPVRDKAEQPPTQTLGAPHIAADDSSRGRNFRG